MIKRMQSGTAPHEVSKPRDQIHRDEGDSSKFLDSVDCSIYLLARTLHSSIACF
jgi:hypothetical protein